MTHRDPSHRPATNTNKTTTATTVWVVLPMFHGLPQDPEICRDELAAAVAVYEALEGDNQTETNKVTTDPRQNLEQFWAEYAAWKEELYEGEADEEIIVYQDVPVR